MKGQWTSWFRSDAISRISWIDNRLFQAGILLGAALIREGKLVQFIPEEVPEKAEQPAIQADVNWQLVKPG